MRLIKGLLGSVIWLVAGLIGLLGVITSLTLVLLPIGIPLLMLAGRLFKMSTALMMPRKARHPVQEGEKALKKRGKKLRKQGKDIDLSSLSGKKLKKAIKKLK